MRKPPKPKKPSPRRKRKPPNRPSHAVVPYEGKVEVLPPRPDPGLGSFLATHWQFLLTSGIALARIFWKSSP